MTLLFTVALKLFNPFRELLDWKAVGVRTEMKKAFLPTQHPSPSPWFPHRQIVPCLLGVRLSRVDFCLHFKIQLSEKRVPLLFGYFSS